MTQQELLDDLILNTGAVKILGIETNRTLTYGSETTDIKTVSFGDNTLGYFVINQVVIAVINDGVTETAEYINGGYKAPRKTITELILERRDQLIAAGTVLGLEILKTDDVGEVGLVKAYFPNPNNPAAAPVLVRYTITLDTNRNLVQTPATADDFNILQNNV